MIIQTQENQHHLKEDNEDNKNEDIQNNNEVANDIRDDKDNRKKDMENHITEHDVVLDMGSGNHALTLFNENEEHILTTEFFIIDETKEFEVPSFLEMNTPNSSENGLNIELFDLLVKEEDSVDFEFLEIFNQENNSLTNNKIEPMELALKSYHARDYANQETIVYKSENDNIYKDEAPLSIEL